jgi:hypothetical protein
LAAILAAAVMLAWPSLINGYPLLNPDSLSYLASGKWIVSALRHPISHAVPDMRSEIYALGIFFLHWNRWLWPVVVCNALLNAGVLWLVVRHTGRSPKRISFLLLVAFLSIGTCIGWPISSILADAYCAPLYLALFLLIFRWEFSPIPERWALTAVMFWGMVAHPTHIFVASGVCVLLALLSLTSWRLFRIRRFQIGLVAAVIACSVLSQTVVHWFLYGKPSFNGPTAPYLSARIIADGPGAWYLQQHCANLTWVLCRHVASLPHDDSGFLWVEGSIWMTASKADQERLLQEQGAFVLSTLRAYPGAQLHRSWRNFRQQMEVFPSTMSRASAPLRTGSA